MKDQSEMTGTEFGRRLLKNLADSPSGQYLFASDLRNIVEKSLLPESGDARPYPMMMYCGPFDAEQTLVVADGSEEAAALAEGWNHNPAKHPPSQYPLNMVEIGRELGARVRPSRQRLPESFAAQFQRRRNLLASR